MNRALRSRLTVPVLALASAIFVLVRDSQGLQELLVDTLAPAQMMVPGGSAQGLAHGFPSGAELTEISLPLRIYSIFRVLGIGVVGATQWMILLEALALFFGIYTAARILRPGAGPLIAALAGTVATVGFALNGHNLAGFGFIFGWNYGFAAGAAAVALAYALRQRWTASVFSVVVVILIHAVIAVLVVLVVAPLALMDIARRQFHLRWSRAVVAVVVGGVYLLASRGDVQTPFGSLDVGAYLARMRAFQFHYFFKFSWSFLRGSAEDIASWLIGVVLVVAASLSLRRSSERALSSRTALMIATVGVLSFLGWAHSNLARPNVTLLIVTLHRSSVFVNLLLLALVLPVLFENALGRRMHATAVAVTVWCLLPSPFDHARFGAVVLVAAVVWVVAELRDERDRRTVVVAAAMVPVTALAAHSLIISPGIAGAGWRSFARSVRANDGLMLAGLVLLSVLLISRRRRFGRELRGASAILVLAALVALVALVPGESITDNPRALTGNAKQRRIDLIDTAAWARTNTAPASIVVLPLTDDGFGWRTFAERASVGKPREWLHYAFLYSRDQRVMDEGTRRAALVGVDVDRWLAENPQLGVGGTLVADLVARFREKSDVEIARFATQLDASYVILELPTVQTGPCLKREYENATFAVFSVQKGCAVES